MIIQLGGKKLGYSFEWLLTTPRKVHRLRNPLPSLLAAPVLPYFAAPAPAISLKNFKEFKILLPYLERRIVKK